MWTVKWWKDVGERAVRTFAAALVGWISVAGVTVGFEDLNWLRGLSLAGIATLTTVLLSISTHGITGNGPSFQSVYKDPPTVPLTLIRGKHDHSRD
jgi:hypothetical protein